MRNLLIAATSLAALAMTSVGSHAQGLPSVAPDQAAAAPMPMPMPMPMPSPMGQPQPLPMPPGMVSVSPQQVFVPQTYVPVQGYVAPQGYVPAPVTVQPNYPSNYVPPGYMPAQPPPPPSQADSAFQQAIGAVLPLTNDMERAARRGYDDSQRHRAEPASGIQTRAGLRSIRLTLRPGETVPVVNLAPGNGSALTFADQTGSAWPVLSATVGDPRQYAVVQNGDKSDSNNIVILSPLSQYGSANMIVTLKGLAVPVIFQLQTGKSANVDSRLDIGVSGRGPNAHYDITAGSALPKGNDPVMNDFADGIPPKGARILQTGTSDVEAWKYNDMFYVRTQLSVLSPAWVGVSKGISDYYVYTFADPRILIVSRDGRTSSVTISR